MPNELYVVHDVTGLSTVYANIRQRKNVLQIWNGTSFVNYSPSSLHLYKIPLAESSSSRIYTANFPSAISADDYLVIVYNQVGPSPAESDTILTHYILPWDGTGVANYRALLSETVPSTYPAGTVGSSIGAIATGQAISIAPVNAANHVNLVLKDDYKVSDGYHLEWTNTGNSWPNLTGATASIIFRDAQNEEVLLTKSMTILNPGGGVNQKLRVELTTAETDVDTLGNKSGRYQILVILSTNSRRTIIAGRWCCVKP